MDHSRLEKNDDRIESLKASNESCRPTNISIPVTSIDEWVEGLLHLPTTDGISQGEGFGQTAAILFAGVFGGFDGPSSIYENVGYRLASRSQGIPVLRIDYRYPAILPSCIQDLRSSMTYLENKYAISRFVLVGWSFGGAVAYTTTTLDRGMVAMLSLISC